MSTSVEDAKASLESIDGNDPRQMRGQVLEAVREAVPCDSVIFTKILPHQGEYHYTGPVSIGDRDVEEFLDEQDGTRAPIEGHWRPERPGPDEQNQFVDMHYDPEKLVDSEDDLLRTVYGANHICTQARSLLYDGKQFLGYFAVWRRRSVPFDDEELRLLNRLREPILSVLAAAERADLSELEVPADVLFEPEGPSVEYASDSASEWLHADRLEALGRVVRRARREDSFPTTRLVDGKKCRVARLDGALGTRYSLTIQPTEPPELAPEAALTPRQREVAEFAAVGATAREIADTLDVSTNTVRDHIRRIYRRLGIGSRAELARKIEG